MQNSQKRICYILQSFPQPSETFIADEAISLIGFGIAPLILYFHDVETSVVHPSARALIESGVTRQVSSIDRATALRSWLRIFIQRPWKAVCGIARAFYAPDRWLQFQAVRDAEWCLDNGVSFLHAHFADNNLIYARAVSRWSGIPYGVTTHRYDLLDEPVPHQNVVHCYNEARLIVTISKYNRDLMVSRYGLPSHRIRIIHCGIDIKRFTFANKVNRATDESLLRIVNVGRLVPVKGQDVLLKALALVRTRGIAFELNIIGAGHMLDELTQLATRLRIDGSVRFSGAQSQPEVIEALHAADLFVLSSRSEGLPVACMETMATGTPIIASRISGIPELIEHGVSGLLVEPDDVEQLANAICWMQNNRRLLPDMARAARRKIESEFERTACSRLLLQSMNLL